MPDDPTPLTPEMKSQIWALWNHLPEGHQTHHHGDPVHIIAEHLALPCQQVAAVVFPPDKFSWACAHEGFSW